jgi:glucosamine-6-phosphate deaminase
MGEAAAADIAACIKKLLVEKDEIYMIFAAAPSQNEMLEALVSDPEVQWNRVHALHMDEYVNLPADAPQGFGNFLRRAIFDKVPFASVNLIGTDADSEATCARYDALLTEHPVDIVCMGIGENGHIAFNDPHVADFNDHLKIKKVDLDQKCRQQQVNDGCFQTIDQVPTHALTLTIPTLYNVENVFCVVPAASKAEAVKNTVTGPVSEVCPASILRNHTNATLYIDADSAALL